MKFLVLQHLEIEPFALIGEAIKEAGHSLTVVSGEKGEPVPQAFDGYDGVIVMGGSMSANDLHLPYIAAEIALLKRAIKADFPVLGVCLGAQLLAKAAGAVVHASPVREIGWYPVFATAESSRDPLFCKLQERGEEGLPVFQWHGETFTLPDSATLLATHPQVPQQAIRIGSSQYGVQFHIEVDRPTIEAWVEAGASERAELGEAGVREMLRQIEAKLPVARRFCREMVTAWLALIADRLRAA